MRRRSMREESRVVTSARLRGVPLGRLALSGVGVSASTLPRRGGVGGCSNARRFEAAAADGVGREEVVLIRGQLRRRKVTRSVGGLAAAVGVLRSAA